MTIDLALAWAKQPADASTDWWHDRLSTVRGFVRYLHGIDPSHEIPPHGLLPRGSHRVAPYIGDLRLLDLQLSDNQFGHEIGPIGHCDNRGWLVQRHGYRTPAAVRADLLSRAA